MDAKKLASLQYHLLPGGTAGDMTLRHLAFQFWAAFWNEVYRSVGAARGPDPRDFDRQSWVSLFLEDGKVVALHAYTAFDLSREEDREHRYFQKYFSPAAMEELSRRGVRRVLTMEYFSVTPEWRSKRVGLSFASVVAGLGVELAQSLGVDGIVSAARTDTGADRIGKAFGAERLATTKVSGVDTELLLFARAEWHPHADPEVSRWVRYFWERRQDGTAKPKAA